MNRRQVLALLGSTTVGGCLGGGRPDDPTRTTGLTTAARTTDTDASPMTNSEAPSTEATTGQRTAEPPEIGEPLPSECPVADDVQRVVCYPDTDWPLSMKPSIDTVSLPTASVSFTLENETDATFVTNYYGWSLHKRVGEEWYHVAPGDVPLPAYHLSSGESHTWNVTVDNSNLHEEIVTVNDTADLQLRGLGGGTYAFGIDGRFVVQEKTTGTAVGSQEETDVTAAVARFDIEGDEIPLSLTDSVTTVEREGETAVVRMAEMENPRQVTVARVDDPREQPESVVAEQVIRTTPLRNALAVFDEEGNAVESVRVENARLLANFTVDLHRTNNVEYESETYRVKVERLDSETTDA